MALTDVQVRAAKPREKDYAISDTEGLSLLVSSTGSKAWHLRYYWQGKQKRMSFGTYPAVGLREARQLRDEAQALLARNINPHVDRKRRRQTARLATQTHFKAVYELWRAHRALSLSPGRQTTLTTLGRVFNKDVLPRLGHRSIFEITTTDLLEVIEPIEKRKALSVAERVRTWLAQLFEYASVKVPGLEGDPTVGLKAVAVPLPPVHHHPFLRLPQLPEFLRAVRRYPGEHVTQLAIRFLLLTAVRTGELRVALPEQFDLDKGTWTIPPDQVKQIKLQMRRRRQRAEDVPPYIVPLSAQAIEIARFLIGHMKPTQRYVFACARSPKTRMSENTVNTALKRIGYDGLLTGHGIRSIISTALHEFGYPTKWVDAQLSHSDPNAVSGSYNHAEYVEQRRVMIQDWADRLDLLEQDQLAAASTHLTLYAGGVPTVEGTYPPASILAAPSALRVITLPDTVNNNPVRRLSAVALPLTQLPQPTEEARKRLALLDAFNAPHNITVVEYAHYAGKSRRWISYEIRARKLLALCVGNRGLRVPVWHLDPVKHALIRAVLERSRGEGAWAIYNALSCPLDELNGRSPIDAVTGGNIERMVKVVRTAIHAARPGELLAG